ncbi:MAG: S8 family serine peptidase [Eubacteriales bacterium]|nr:S8 family serine peptidase [Eubacteriales bacterium]
MKKLLCVLLCAVICLIAVIPFKINHEREFTKQEAETFCSAVATLNEKYDDSSKYSSLKFDLSGEKIAGATNNRIIVKGENVQSDLAIDRTSGVGYTIFQYENSTDMLSDYSRLETAGEEVQKDTIFYCCEDDSVSSAESVGKWGYKSSGADYVKNYMQKIFSMFDKDNDVEETEICSSTGARDIVVGIMDSGIDTSHSIFDGRYVENNINFSSSGNGNSSDDDYGHGTSVAGVVVQSTPENVKVKSYKVLDKNGTCSAAQVISACEYILAEENKPDIINMSFVGYSSEDAVLENQVISRLVDAGITVCVSAGNDFVPASYASPAGNSDVITVSSYAADGSFSNFSCYGDAVDICAPGEDIYCAEKGGGYSEKSGTSFASPFVSAACAYVLMLDNSLKPEKVKEMVLDSAVNMGEYESYYFGSGILSIPNLIEQKSCPDPEISTEGGTYYDSVEISFTDIDERGKLYYTLDRTVPDEESGILYTEPFEIDEDTLVTYALISDGDYLSNIKSEYFEVKHILSPEDITIDTSGNITAYSGEKKNIVIPDTVNGITPTSVVKEVFKDSDITAVTLPDSVKTLGASCFENCTSLKYIVAEGVESFTGSSVFFGCSDLRVEAMPNLKKASDSAFYGCSKLHSVDFKDSLTSIESQMFAKSGLLTADFKNSVSTSNSYKSFRETPISSCTLTGCDTITSYMFSGCKFLKNLDCTGVKEIMSYAFKDCNMLKSIDASQVEKMSANALDSSYFDVFYAPKCTTVAGGKSPFSKYSYIRVLDLPALTDKLCTRWMCFSTIEELYLDSVTEMSSACFANTPKLSTVFLPNVDSFHTPYVNTIAAQTMIDGNEIFKEKPPLRLVWIPKAETISGTISLENPEVFFAPSSELVCISITKAEKPPVIVVSPDISSINFTVANFSGEDYTVISTPECALNKSSSSYNFVSCLDVTAGEDADGYSYSCGGNIIKLPADFVKESWSADCINKNREDNLYQFVLDLNNDNCVNAKDFAVLNDDAA